MAEYNGEVIPLDNEPVGAKPYIGEVTPLKNVSTSEAFGRGVESGLTAGFGDELKGLYAAGAPHEPSPKQELSTLENIANLGTTREAALLQTIKGAYNYLTGAPEAEKKYEETKAKENQAFEEAKKQHPIATMIGEVGGSIPTTMLLPGGTAATAGKLGQRMLRGAQVGAEYGAIQGAGEGEGLEGRLTGAGVGALTGGVGGAAAPAVVTGVSKLVANPLQKVVSVVKGWRFPEAEAAKRVASALAKDEADIVAGNAQGMTRSDWVKARDAGEPVTIADLGASNTQALLRSAANTSPEARNILEKVIYERFEGQSERVSRDIRQLVSGGANRFKTADQLEAEYRVAANPAYKEAYAHPNAQSMWDSTIANLARAPVVQDAIKLATKEAENEAVRVGASPIRHPFKIDQNGNLSIANPNMKTNLAFWDIVKQNLDDKVSALYRSGEKNAGNRAKDIKNDFLSHLDDLVPDYKKARGVAADYFNASNALEAGSKAANTKVFPEEISKLMRSMRPEERDLFREGYASSWSEKILAMRDRRDVTGGILTGGILASPQERRMAGIVFGVDNIAKIETRIDLERIMDGARKALGNSTTARQLIEAGLAGGAGAGIGYEGGGGWGAAAGAVSGAAGARHQAGKAISKGLEHAAKYADRGTARRVAEMLVSDDPNVLGEGLRIASRNRNIAEGLKSIADRLGVIAAEKASSGIQPRIIPQITIHKEPSRATGGSVFDKMHMARKRAEGGGTDAPFNEWDAVPRNAEGIPQIRIQKPPVNEADEAQAAREAAHDPNNIGMSEADYGGFASTGKKLSEGIIPKMFDAIIGEPSRQMKSFGYPVGSEEDDFLNAGKRRDAMYWGPDMALNMVGIGGPLAMTNAGKNAIGIAGGRGLTAFEKDTGDFLSKNNLPAITPEQNLANIQSRIRQIEYDRRLSKIDGEAYPNNPELTSLRSRARELGNPALPMDSGFLLGSGTKDKTTGKAVAAEQLANAALEQPQGIRAYHGSPHDFDKFDLAKIGTGEGAQAYGHGLYFAENPATAQAYRETLGKQAGGPEVMAQDWIRDWGDQAVAKLEARIANSPSSQTQWYNDIKTAVQNNQKPGRMYEVNINAKPEQFLDWDKPLAGQSDKLGPVKDVWNNVRGTTPEWGHYFPWESQTGRDAYTLLSSKAPRDQITAGLQDAGIPGIKYLDQGSRGTSGGTSNYVVFDPNIIEIMKKYGMTLPAATAAYEAMKSNQEKTGFKKGGSVFDKMKRASK